MTYKKFFARIIRNEVGATAIEYGLIAALIAVTAIMGMQSLGSSLSENFDATADALGSVSTQ
jgi:pilus assembly protein Flp/PilA